MKGTIDMNENKIEVMNSYDNTGELLKKFPVLNPTPVCTQMEKNIQNRLLTGFENWNRGFEAWKAWGDILYTPASLYNVHAVHLTLTEYQNAMKATLRANDIQMGDFKNMVIVDDWCAIHYEIATIRRDTGEVHPGSVMEFVRFQDYGPELGTRVVEGWAGTRGADYAGLGFFQNAEEKAAQKTFMDAIAAIELPETDDLVKKYPVLYPTAIRTEQGERIRDRILSDFEHWNRGYADWSSWADSYYSRALVYHADGGALSLEEYKASERENGSKRLFFDSFLISGDWAAIHYRTVENGEAGSRMQFLRFADEDGSLKVAECWTK